MKSVVRAFLRYLKRRRSLSLLQVLGIGCGVAAIIGMVFSARAALWSFGRAVQFLSGKATHSIERPAGPIEDSLVLDLLRDPAVQALSPVIDRRLRLASGDLVRILAVDPLLDRDIRSIFPNDTGPALYGTKGNAFLSFLIRERAVFIDGKLAKQIGAREGTIIDTSRGPLEVVGLFSNPSEEPLLMIDIAHGQRLFGLKGLVDRVDLIVTEARGFYDRWSVGFRIQSIEQRAAAFTSMLQAFKLNLQALSLLALFVGVFLIYNTAMFTVVSRRKDAGILRSLGATRVEIAVAFLVEILVLGIAGGAVGAVAGYLLSRFLTALVGTTISDLYFFLKPSPLPWSSSIVLQGMALGCLASVVGGLHPLWELLRVRPVEALRNRPASTETHRQARRLSIAGGAIVVVSIILLLLSHLGVYVGFAGSFGLLFGASLGTGLVLLGLSPLLRKTLGAVAGVTGRVAAGNITRNMGRTAVAAAAFMVALSMTIGLGSMIGSFRHSLIWWMGTQLRADLYVGSTAEGIEVPEAVYDEFRQMPGLLGVDPYRNVQVAYRGVLVTLAAVDASVLQRYTQFGWLKGGNENWEPVKQGGVAISESFSRNFHVAPGDIITLPSARGPAQFPIAAVFYDYTSEHGVIMMDRSTYVGFYNDRTINSLGLFIDPTSPERKNVIARAREKAAERGLPVQTQGELRQKILSVFDSTFAVTRSMRIIAIVVAFFGIAGALMTLFIERQREFGIYRALGFSTRQVTAMTLLEGLGMGLVSLLFSFLVGTALAYVLIKVINLQSFNWTIFFHLDSEPYLLAAATALLASAGAALYPMWKVWRTYPQMQIREE